MVNPELGWRSAFALGAVLALGVLLVRRNVPDIDRTVTDESDRKLSTVTESLTIRQRKTISLPTIAKTVFPMETARSASPSSTRSARPWAGSAVRCTSVG